MSISEVRQINVTYRLYDGCKAERDTLYSIIAGKDKIIANDSRIMANMEANAKVEIRGLKRGNFGRYLLGVVVGAFGTVASVVLLR